MAFIKSASSDTVGAGPGRCLKRNLQILAHPIDGETKLEFATDQARNGANPADCQRQHQPVQTTGKVNRHKAHMAIHGYRDYRNFQL